MNIGFETEQLEFKKSTAELKEGIISLASMLNKHKAGVLYFGIRNDGEVVGQQLGADSLREISQAIANFIKPQIIPSISYELLDNKDVIKITVSGNERPYSAYGKYYIRSADEDREITPSLLRKLMLNGKESIALIESSNQNLTFNQLKVLYSTAGLTLNEDTFRDNLHLLNQDKKYNLLADILSDSNSYSIKIAKFKGKDKTELITRNEYGFKCLLMAMKQVLSYADAINETSVKMTSAERIETKLFDTDCFREAWLNACLHNSWVKRTPPAVYFFEDRIEIISTGGLPDDLSLDDFYAGRSMPVNLELQQIMVQLDLIEQTGHGVPLIVSKYGKDVFKITENFITVVLPLNKPQNEPEKKPIKTTYILSKKQKLILDSISGNHYITIAELAELCSVTPTAINNNLKYLKDNGLIERLGAKKNGYWELSEIAQRIVTLNEEQRISGTEKSHRYLIEEVCNNALDKTEGTDNDIKKDDAV